MSLHQGEVSLANWDCNEGIPALTITNTNTSSHGDNQDLLEGLFSSPKSVPTRFCYDDIGSALFTQRCNQPEYYLMRTEQKILIDNADELSNIVGSAAICDFGSGNAEKIPIILRAFARAGGQVTYVPIDINRKYLELGAKALIKQFPDLRVHGLRGTYEQALPFLPIIPSAKMLMMLGSTIGNMTDGEIQALYRTAHKNLRKNDYLLIGADLDKDPVMLEAAYNDVAGVGTRMELNVLTHLNNEFDGNFKIGNYEHKAVYVPKLKRVEARLYSKEDQRIELKSIGIKFSIRHNEHIKTDIMRKFVPYSLIALMEEMGLHHCRMFNDADNLYGLFLFQRS